MRKVFIFILFLPFLGWSQTNSVSPYTLFGVGDLSDGYFVKNMSLGGSSSALRDPLFINVANPASLTSLRRTTLEMAATHRWLRQTDEKTETTLNNQSTFINYFSFAFSPDSNIEGKWHWWGTGISLMPYSKVGYNIFTFEDHPDFGSTKYLFEGSGGINQVIWGNSFNIIKGLHLGINARYLFGNTQKTSSAEFENTDFNFSRRRKDSHVSDFTYDIGMQYVQSIKSSNVEDGYDYDLIIGATYGPSSNIKTTQRYTDYSYRLSNGTEVPLDTVNKVDGLVSNITLPSKYSAGLSFGQKNPLLLGYSWMLIGDFHQSNWSEYRNVEGEAGLNDSWRASIGGYFTPRYAFNMQGKSSYLSRMEWRFGAFYENTNLQIENEPISIMGATFGFDMPFFPKNELQGMRKMNHINFGIVVGSKSSGADALIREDFINLTFGLTLNDLWFEPRKYR